MVKYHPRLKLIHGFQARQHPLYIRWICMRSRCEDPENPSYHNYGGRGITVCDEWSKAFEPFALDMGLPPSPEHTLERKNNSLNYNKNNCIWANRTEQCLNRRIFSNNTSGFTGVHQTKNGTYVARYDEYKKRYNLGRFITSEDAAEYRAEFIFMLHKDKETALLMTERRARLDSATGVKGITKNQDGYLVRVTLLDSTRKYLGFSKTLEGAKKILESFNGEYK